jgi:hypothetical protein
MPQRRALESVSRAASTRRLTIRRQASATVVPSGMVRAFDSRRRRTVLSPEDLHFQLKDQKLPILISWPLHSVLANHSRVLRSYSFNQGKPKDTCFFKIMSWVDQSPYDFLRRRKRLTQTGHCLAFALHQLHSMETASFL